MYNKPSLRARYSSHSALGQLLAGKDAAQSGQATQGDAVRPVASSAGGAEGSRVQIAGRVAAGIVGSEEVLALARVFPAPHPRTQPYHFHWLPHCHGNNS